MLGLVAAVRRSAPRAALAVRCCSAAGGGRTDPRLLQGLTPAAPADADAGAPAEPGAVIDVAQTVVGLDHGYPASLGADELPDFVRALMLDDIDAATAAAALAGDADAAAAALAAAEAAAAAGSAGGAGAAGAERPEVDAEGRAYATGRRKKASARVWLAPGAGAVRVNGRPLAGYLERPEDRSIVVEPLAFGGGVELFDVWATVKGGGKRGQSEALRHGVANALARLHPPVKPFLAKAGLLARDPRVKERKHTGKTKARKGWQWVKR